MFEASKLGSFQTNIKVAEYMSGGSLFAAIRPYIVMGTTIYLIRTHYERLAAGLENSENQNPDKNTGLF